MEMNPGDLTGILAVVGIFGIPLLAIWTSHRRKILELQLKMRNDSNAEVQGAIKKLREEMQALRETSMQYDISFDTALQRIERRVNVVESRVMGTDKNPTVELSPGASPDNPTIELRPGRLASQNPTVEAGLAVQTDENVTIELRPRN